MSGERCRHSIALSRYKGVSDFAEPQCVPTGELALHNAMIIRHENTACRQIAGSKPDRAEVDALRALPIQYSPLTTTDL